MLSPIDLRILHYSFFDALIANPCFERVILNFLDVFLVKLHAGIYRPSQLFGLIFLWSDAYSQVSGEILNLLNIPSPSLTSSHGNL